MTKGYCKKHKNNECLAIAIVYHVSNRILKKKTYNLPLKFGYFHFSVLGCSHQNLDFPQKISIYSLFESP